MSTTDTGVKFTDLGLSKAVTNAITELGYSVPSPIQAQSIPALLQKRDLLGQAQTGTGKTAAFALPLLTRINLNKVKPQALVLVPTRELAIQVAAAFEKYAANIPEFRSIAVYGGQGFGDQLRALRNGVHLVVGTPGRIMDHMRRTSLDISEVDYLVLDEADEMLRMGFAEDVEWILQHTPEKRQTVLFSATMPREIESIANQFMRNPVEVKIPKAKADEIKIRQRYLILHNSHQKLDSLTRILEAESFDAMIVFVRTKMISTSVAESLKAKGYACAALNGDIAQNQREQTIEQLKSGRLNIIVATDVAARGIDVARVSHVINYDIPHDIEAYIHRIGRTGRAGRKGDTILFLSPREQRMMFAIEKATKQTLEQFHLPTVEQINTARIERFKQRITDTINDSDLSFFSKLIKEYQLETKADPMAIAAALASLVQGKQSFFMQKSKDEPREYKRDNVAKFERTSESRRRSGYASEGRGRFSSKDKPEGRGRFTSKDSEGRSRFSSKDQSEGRGRFSAKDKPEGRSRFSSKDQSEGRGRFSAKDKPEGRNSRFSSKDQSEGRGRFSAKDKPSSGRDRFASKGKPAARGKAANKGSFSGKFVAGTKGKRSKSN